MDILIKYLKKKITSKELEINKLEEKIEELQDELDDLEYNMEEKDDEIRDLENDKEELEDQVQELKKICKYDGDPINMQYLINNIQVKLNQLGPVKLNELIENI